MKRSRSILNIKKLTLLLLLLVVIIPIFSNAAVSDGTSSSGSTFTLKNPLKVDSVGGLVQNFVEIFSYIVILFAVLALVYVGLRFILARGDATQMKELKEWLLWIVVGVAVVIGARIIIQVVINTLSATGTIDQGIINSTQDALNNR